MELGFEEFLVRLNRGCLLRDQLNRLSESYADAKRAIELKPEDPQARTNYTQVLYLLGDDPALANRRWPLRLRNWLLRKLRAAMGAYLSIDVLKGHTDEKISALMNHIDQQMNGLNERMDQSEELKGYIDQQTAELRRHIGVEMAALMERVREFTGLTSRVDGVTSALQDIDRLRNESSKLSNTIEQVQAQFPLLYDRLNKLALSNEDYSLDMISMRLSGLDCTRLVKLTIATASPLAVESDDYKFPRGAKNDNTRHPRFVVKSEKVFDRKLFHLDLGCAGGGLVWDFILAGHQSYGIDGSDYSQVNRRAIWRVLPGNLFTADITKPFYFVDESGIRRRFDLITAWEVLEHLSEASLCGLFRNLHDNLSESGLFVASIATFEDADCAIGAVYHLTVKPWSWWAEQFRVAGFEIVEGPYEPKDFVRGSGNPRADDWDVTTAPELGFHLVVRKR
jgi:2-polyprenyl-3-methyl-5-hydroxy-6-metoxy-1,4-benzoquinol methylase